MANLTVTIPDAVMGRVFDAFASEFNYNPLTDGTKAQFGRKCIMNLIKGVVKGYEADQAAFTARTNALNTAENDIQLS